MAQNHDSLPTFDPGRGQATISPRWANWLEVWELYLDSKELGTISSGENDEAKTLKHLFLLKKGNEAREIYNSKRKAEKSDKRLDIINL